MAARIREGPQLRTPEPVGPRLHVFQFWHWFHAMPLFGNGRAAVTVANARYLGQRRSRPAGLRYADGLLRGSLAGARGPGTRGGNSASERVRGIVHPDLRPGLLLAKLRVFHLYSRVRNR
jgi:hypothetical protein